MQGTVPTSRQQRRLERDFITGGTGLLVARQGDDLGAATASEAATAREAWTAWLAPRFDRGAAYFTGTYSDDYGLPHGLMLARNVHHDFRRFLVERGLTGQEFINGVEQHQYRDVLHLHAIIGGDFTDLGRRLLKAEWEASRGYARVLPVLDGCASYVTKYALKGDTVNFDWNLA
jgi:hypothetical protein